MMTKQVAEKMAEFLWERNKDVRVFLKNDVGENEYVVVVAGIGKCIGASVPITTVEQFLDLFSDCFCAEAFILWLMR
jgi:hypothetical protein